MSRKTRIALVVAFSFFAAILIRLVIANENNQRLLVDYDNQVDQLLANIEATTRRRVEAENMAQELQAQLARTSTRIQNLDRQLQQAQQKIDPDYQQVEQRIRAQVTRQFQQQQALTEPRNSVASLINEVSALDSQTRNALFSVQSRFGDYLSEYISDPVRREQIGQALLDYTIEMDQVRDELLSQELGRREMREQLVQLFSPQAMQDALGYEMTETELEQFDAYLQEQGNFTQAFVRRGPVTGSGISQAVRIPPDAIPQGDLRIFNVTGDSGRQEIIIDSGTGNTPPTR